VAGRQQRAVADLSVARLVPRDPRKVILGLKILETNIPDERAERLDRIHFVALRANESKAECFIGILWKTLLPISRVVVPRVFEGVESRVAHRHRAALKRLIRATQ